MVNRSWLTQSMRTPPLSLSLRPAATSAGRRDDDHQLLVVVFKGGYQSRPLMRASTPLEGAGIQGYGSASLNPSFACPARGGYVDQVTVAPAAG
jgi:hypothetical protein